MKWTDHIDGYCERLDPSFWSEPVNAVTNAAFVIATIFVLRRVQTPAARWLCAVLGAIGVGSFLFHTFATPWAALADVAPIGLFILTYLFLVNRDLIGLRGIWALAATACFVPYAAVFVTLVNHVPFFEISNFYWTVPVLLVIYGGLFRISGFVTGAGILALSITLRSLDMTVCDAWPVGTHFAWHCLNAVMLGYMILVYDRHRLAGQGRRG